MSARPNIVLCTCDQLRAFEVGCYGNEVIRTPHIDRIASEGIRFETAVTNYPVCMAARSVLLSAQYNRTCTGGVGCVCFPGMPGDFNMPEYPDAGRPHLKEPTLAEVLREHGYHTAVIGKWHIHSWPNDVGFDRYLIPRVHHCHTGQSFTENGGPEFVPDGFSVDFEAERVERFLEERRRSRGPFFLYYNISPPHCPVADAPDQYRTMYGPQDVPLRRNVPAGQRLEDQEYWFKVYRWDFRYYSLHLPYTEALPDPYTLRHLIAEYYGMTTWMDSAVGRMLGALDANGLRDNTIVVFTSDHGDNLGSHGLVQKGGPNEESIRIPLVVRWAQLNQAPSVVRGQVVSLVDVAPTLLSLADVPVPGHCQGRDLAPLVRGKADAADAFPAFVETASGAAVRTATHMCFIPFSGRGRALDDQPTQLFDLVEDPYQLDNLAQRAGSAGIAKDLAGLLRRWDDRTPWSCFTGIDPGAGERVRQRA